MKFLVLSGALSVTACGTGFDHLDYAPIGGVPAGARLEPTLVSLPAGSSVAARVVAIDESGSAMECEPTLVSEDTAIMDVQRADRGSIVFSAISAGETTLVVHCGTDGGGITGRVTSSPGN